MLQELHTNYFYFLPAAALSNSRTAPAAAATPPAPVAPPVDPAVTQRLEEHRILAGIFHVSAFNYV